MTKFSVNGFKTSYWQRAKFVMTYIRLIKNALCAIERFKAKISIYTPKMYHIDNNFSLIQHWLLYLIPVGPGIARGVLEPLGTLK